MGIEDWNALNPGKAVAKGHCLVEVNGIRTFHQMLYECCNACKLSMTFSIDRVTEVTDMLAEQQGDGFPPEGSLCHSRFPPAATGEDHISADQHVHEDPYRPEYIHGKGRKSWPSVASFEALQRNTRGIHGKGQGPHRMNWPTYGFDQMHGKGAYPLQGGLFYRSQLGDYKPWGNISDVSVHEARA